MIDPYFAAGLLALWAAMSAYDGIATAYDESRRSLDWDHCQCSGSFRDVMTWWWRR